MHGDRSAETAYPFFPDLKDRVAKNVCITSDAYSVYEEVISEVFAEDANHVHLVRKYSGDTSYIERHNLTIRMSMRRYTRLTNAFSKRVRNHVSSFALIATHYNFCRVHQTTGMTPAHFMGIADRFWTPDDLVRLVEADRPKPGKRGPYQKGAFPDA